MGNKTYTDALSKLDTISKKITLYTNNNATVPENMHNDFALTVIDVLDKFAMDIGSEKLDMLSSEIACYYETLEEKVSADIGSLSPIKRSLLIQGYSSILNNLQLYSASNYLDTKLLKRIMHISNLLDKSCAVEFKKTELYLKEDFDYDSYFFDLRNSSVEIATKAYSDAINNLLTATSDDDFYHYLELCSSSGTALDAIVLLG